MLNIMAMSFLDCYYCQQHSLHVLRGHRQRTGNGVSLFCSIVGSEKNNALEKKNLDSFFLLVAISE